MNKTRILRIAERALVGISTIAGWEALSASGIIQTPPTSVTFCVVVWFIALVIAGIISVEREELERAE